MEKKRIDWVDMAKGYCIIAVVITHVYLGLFSDWLNTFDLPLFFFLSGYFFSAKSDFRTFFAKKCRTLLLPYFTLGLPMLVFDIVWRIYQGTFLSSDIIKFVKTFLLQTRSYTLWYLACLLLLNFLFYFMVKLLRTPAKLAIASVLLAVIAQVYYHFGGQALYWNADVCLGAVPFFCAGYLCKPYREKINSVLGNIKYAAALFLVGGAVNGLCSFLSYHYAGNMLNFFHCTYGIAPLTYLGAFGGIVCVAAVASRFTLRPIRYLGENSLIYFAWHQTIMIPIVTALLNALHWANDMHNPLYILTQTVLIFAILTPVCILLNKTKLRILLGKK